MTGSARREQFAPQSKRPFDPITFEVLRNAFDSILDEMSLTILRTAHSTIVRDAMDFSTSFFSKEGELLAQGRALPFHLGSMPDAMAAVIRYVGGELRPGDIVILNDPFEGGSHLQDIFMFRPIFIEDGLVGFTATSAHHTDVGGRVPGSNASDSTEIYQEGIRIPPMRLFSSGRPVNDVFRMIEANVRVPHMVLGDLHAQVAACETGEKHFMELVARYGLPTLSSFFDEVLMYAERVTRAEIAELPSGVYSFTDYLDDDGVSEDPIPICVKLTVRRDDLTVDLTGTSTQVAAAINATESFTKSSIYVVIRSVMASDIPINAGFFRPIQVIAPSGTIVNVAPPGAVAARAIAGFRVIDALFGALAQAVPERVFAAGEGGNTFVTLAGNDPHGKPYIMVEPQVGCWGARPDRDGIDGISPLAANIRNTSAEVLESDYPIRIDQYELITDSGGPGRFRGGMSVGRSIRLLGPDALLQVRSDRRRVLPYGLFGGRPGRPSENRILREGSSARVLPSKFIATLPSGSVYGHTLASGGGYGDPLERDPALVLHDVRLEKVSRKGARRDYGVVVKGRRPGLRVDVEATQAQRLEFRSERGARGAV